VEPLIDTDWLLDHLGDPRVVVLEVSSTAGDAARYYTEGHIPGSAYAWWKDLCWDDTDREFPTSDVMTGRLRALGVNDDSLLILVGDPIQFATYTYWVLTMTGFEHVARVLDGGRRAWEEQELPLDLAAPARGRGTVSPQSPRTESRVGRDDVREHLGDPSRVLIDMRTDEEFSGERVSPRTSPFDHGAERTGRIPGARHLYFEELLTGDGTFLPATEIDARFRSAGATEDADVVTYCRLSHRATLGWFAATRISGWRNVRVYDGSWTEWGSIVGFPIER